MIKIELYFRNITSAFSVLSLIFSSLFLPCTAYANLPVTPDGSTNTVINKAPNSVPIIEIATPDAGGVSRNNFTDYNVNRSGLIINNAAVRDYGNGGVRTNIGGMIMTNTHLRDSGSARVILNQVTSNRITRINGYSEIAGRKADLVIANPNGITINGGGFINTDRLGLLVGQEVRSNNAINNLGGDVNGDYSFDDNLYFKITSAPHLESGFLPKLTISESGLDLTKVDRASFVANIIEINAGIYADNNNVGFLAGDNVYDYNEDVVDANNNVNDGVGDNNIDQDPQIAIDAASFSDIQAGNIFMVASKQGFGVNYSGSILAQGQINISANGDIYYENASVAGSSLVNNSNNGDVTFNNSDSAIVNNIDIDANNVAITNNSNVGAGDITINVDIDNQNNGNINIDQSSKILSSITGDGNYNDLNIVANSDIDNNGQIISEGALSLIANNGDINLNSSSILSSKQAMNLAANNGNINNHDGGEIISGSDLSLVAKTVNQLSKNSVVVDGNHIIAANDYYNTGRIDISGDLTMNIINNLVNGSSEAGAEQGAMIFAGNNMFLNIGNDLTNNQNSAIYAGNDLTIRKLDPSDPNYDAADNRSNKVDNISAEITAYAGNINIDANEVINRRAILPTQGAEVHAHYHTSYTNGNIYHHFYRSEIQGDEAPYGLINSANNLTINSNSLTNNSSSIFAGNDITLEVDLINNISNLYRDYVRYRVNGHNATYGGDRYWYTGTKYLGNGVSYANGSHIFTANIKAGNNITSTTEDNINNTTTEHTAANFSCTHRHLSYTCHNRVEIPTGTRALDGALGVVAEQSSDISSLDVENARSVNSLSIPTLLANGQLDFDFSNYFADGANQGMIQRSSNPNTPLFESRSQFIDQNQFFTSDYFYQALGVNLDNLNTQLQQANSRLIGDQFFQAKVIAQQIKNINKNSLLLSATEINANLEMKNLADNAAEESTRLGLDLNEELTQEQIDSLDKDIMWYQFAQINGESYIIPKIYLTKTTRQRLKDGNNIAKSSTIFANSDINLTTGVGEVNNSGSISAGNNINITANSNINNNNFSEIIASGDINLTSLTGNITNKSVIKSDADNNNDGDINIAANNFINTATVATNAKNLLNEESPAYIANGIASANSGNIRSIKLESASLTGNNININANNDVSNIGSNINSNANLIINAGNDLNIDTVKLRNRTESIWGNNKKGGTSITDTTTNIGSNIASGGNTTLNATNSINITGSDVNSTGDATLTAGNEVNIASAQDSYYNYEARHKKSLTYAKSSVNIIQRITNRSSNILTDGNITITSGNDLNITASDLAGQSGSLVAGIYLDNDPNSATFNQTIINNDANVNIINAKDTNYTFSENKKTKMSFNVKDFVVRSALAGPAYGLISASNKDKTTTKIANTKQTVVKSNLNFNNNLTITAAKDLVIKSSDLTTNIGDIDLNATNISILADNNTDVTDFDSSVNGLFGSNKSDQIDIYSSNAVSANIKAGIASNDGNDTNGNLNITATNDVILQGSYLAADRDVNITTGNNLSLLAAQNIYNKSHVRNDETTFNFTNGVSGTTKTDIVHNSIFANQSNDPANNQNTNFNIGGNILVQYNKDDGTSLDRDIPRLSAIELLAMSEQERLDYERQYQQQVTADHVKGINGSSLEADYANKAGLEYISQLDPNQTFYQKVSEIDESYSQTVRGLTETGSSAIAVAAVAIAVGSGGLGSGISGAMMTAGATTGSTTATVAATNTSMNSDGDIFKQIKDVNKDAWDASTSRESVENIAIAAGVAGAAYWAVTASGGTTSLQKGADNAVYKPDPYKMATDPKYRAFVETNYPDYNGVIDPSANNIGMANTTTDMSKIGTPVPDFSSNPTTSSFWDGFTKEGGFISDNVNKIAGMNSMSLTHDPWSQNAILSKSPILQLTIPPAIAVQYCATFPAACASAINKDNLINEQ